jgi:hypothetical protein
VNPRIVSVTASIDYSEVGAEKKVGLASAHFQRIQRALENNKNQVINVRMDLVNSTFHLPTAAQTEVDFSNSSASSCRQVLALLLSLA